MAVHSNPPPPECHAVLTDGFVKRDRTVGLGTPLDIVIEHTHPIYHLGLRNLIANRDLTQTELLGWQYLLLHGGHHMGALVLERSGNYHFSMGVAGPYIDSLPDALKIAELIADIDTRKFELAALQIPGLSALAVWLRGENDEGWLVPVANRWPQLAARIAWRSNEFCGALIQPAEDRLAFDPRAR